MKVDLSRAVWRRSARSANDGQCVEVAFVDGAVAVRDSKDPAGEVLLFTPREWAAFLDGVTAGEFDTAP